VSIDEVVLPAEPISAATRRMLVDRMHAAQQRWEQAVAAYRMAEQTMQNERRICDMIDDLLRAGPGHVFSPAVLDRNRSFLAYCRHCRAAAGSTVGRQPCHGDTHDCPYPLEPGESAAAINIYRREMFLCRSRGVMAPDFTSWRCESGHVIDALHAQSSVRHVLAPCDPLTCPWPDLIIISGKA
jgi:hypothetical protein